jgi:cob(I)alamin adenosyltransferase
LKIYTKTGDNGSTSLLFGKRVSKSSLRIDCYGTVDELNSNLGLLGDLENEKERKNFIREIQNNLFVIGSNLACERKENSLSKINVYEIEVLEDCIDQMNEELPELRHFIIPGGHQVVSICHICRTICRRAERIIVGLSEIEHIDSNIITYLNRLSDYLFVLSRKIGQELGVEEVKWKEKNN